MISYGSFISFLQINVNGLVAISLVYVVFSEKCKASELLIVGWFRLSEIVHQIDSMVDRAVVFSPPVTNE
mgnify:CR=1 FL=1